MYKFLSLGRKNVGKTSPACSVFMLDTHRTHIILLSFS